MYQWFSHVGKKKNSRFRGIKFVYKSKFMQPTGVFTNFCSTLIQCHFKTNLSLFNLFIFRKYCIFLKSFITMKYLQYYTKRQNANKNMINDSYSICLNQNDCYIMMRKSERENQRFNLSIKRACRTEPCSNLLFLFLLFCTYFFKSICLLSKSSTWLK